MLFSVFAETVEAHIRMTVEIVLLHCNAVATWVKDKDDRDNKKMVSVQSNIYIHVLFIDF